MKIIHTSDWHLGSTWNSRSRQREYAAFLDWMLETLKTERPDALIVSGDVFDTATPSPTVQAMYFDFLQKAAAFCRKIVVTAGNHDSPLLLDAPKTLLRSMNVHVVGSAIDLDEQSPDDELVVLENADGEPEMIIAAVPFLRDRDLRRSETGESAEDKARKIVKGIRHHYAEVCQAAENIRGDRSIPLIAMGHLFAAGQKTPEGVRDIHVGTLDHFGADVFPEGIDYLALGHIHQSMPVFQSETKRYSGSPLPMSFAEAGREKFLFRVDFDGRQPTIRPIPIPTFSDLFRVSGDLPEIEAALKSLPLHSDRDAFVEIRYTGTELIPDLAQQIDQIAETLPKNLHILRIRNDRMIQQLKFQAAPLETLEELHPMDVFNRLLQNVRQQGKEIGLDDVPESELIAAYREILEQTEHADR